MGDKIWDGSGSLLYVEYIVRNWEFFKEHNKNLKGAENSSVHTIYK